MINVSEARIEMTKIIAVNKMEAAEGIEKVIMASIKLGNNVANYYPQNSVKLEVAMEILLDHGYEAQIVKALDQRDRDYIKIIW